MNISANLVVKNEAEFIEKVLRQVVKLADEILIADMGSTDGTMRIAEQFPVQIFLLEDKRPDEARNFLLKMSRGDWIWIVDGDEVWPDEELEKLRKLPEEYPDKIAFAFTFRHFLPSGNEARHKARPIRLFRRTPDIRWAGIFPNEILVDDKGKVITQAGANIPRQEQDIKFIPDIKFEHYGGIKKSQWRAYQPKKYENH